MSERSVMSGRLEDLPFNEQVAKLDEIADQMTAIVEERGSMSSREVLRAASDNLRIAESQAKYGLSYAQSSGRLVRDPGSWNLSTTKLA